MTGSLWFRKALGCTNKIMRCHKPMVPDILRASSEPDFNLHGVDSVILQYSDH